ncbi:O-antigen ligase family protein [Candidatus Pelagibacter sp.]|uniref:O-antigen ligase family protein n=1 Tax=Candidatus Pelagibacter sp. TaxID=2024849 RepID=UPI003D0AAF3F
MINIKKNILTNNQIKYLSYLISLVPAALIAGAFIADLIASFCAIFFLYISVKEKLKIIYSYWIVKLLILFCIYLILKSIINSEEFHSILRSFFYIRYVLFSLLICYIYNLNPKFSKIFFKILTLTLITLSIHAYLIHFFNFDLLRMNFNQINIEQNFSLIYNQWNVPFDYRISGLFYSESVLGSYVEKILPIYLGLVFLNKKSAKYYLLSIVFLFLIIISGERSSIALSILFLITFFFTYETNLKGKVNLILIFLLIFVFVFSNPNLKKRIVDNTFFNITEKIIHLNQDEEILKKDELNKLNKNDQFFQNIYLFIKEKLKINIFSLGHQGHFISAFKIFINNPLFGIGIKNFRYECKKPEYKDIYSCTTHPHNTYMQLLAETGIIGFLFIFTIFTFLSYKIFTIIFFRKIRKKLSNHFKCFLLGVFINFWPLVPTGSFFNNWISICYFLSLGFFLGEIYKNISQNKI